MSETGVFCQLDVNDVRVVSIGINRDQIKTTSNFCRNATHQKFSYNGNPAPAITLAQFCCEPLSSLGFKPGSGVVVAAQ